MRNSAPVSRIWAPIGLISALVSGCAQQSTPVATRQESAPAAVKVTVARLHDWPRTVRVQGSLIGDEDAVVGGTVAGLVMKVNVDLGTVVRKGDVLAELDPIDFELKVQQAAAQLAQARARLGLSPDQPESALTPERAPTVQEQRALLEEALANRARARTLREKNAISAEEVQQREAAYNVADARYHAAINGVEQQIAMLGVFRADLALAKQAQANSVIVAPFDGIVSRRQVAPGVYLQVGDSVVTLVRTNPLRFRVGVPERDATLIALGQQVQIQVGELKPIRATVSRISPELDQNNRSLTVEIDVPNPDARLRAGLFAEAAIVVDPDAQALAVPRDAVSEFAGVEKVWIIQDGKAREQRVRTGRRDATLVEVISGLNAGSRVALDAAKTTAGNVAVTEEVNPSRHAE